jgi:xanthine/uracil permease
MLYFLMQSFNTTWGVFCSWYSLQLILSAVDTFIHLQKSKVLGKATLVMFASITVAGVNYLTTDAVNCQKVLL